MRILFWPCLFFLIFSQVGHTNPIKKSENPHQKFIDSFSKIYESKLQLVDIANLNSPQNLEVFFRLYNDLQLSRNAGRLNVLGNSYRDVMSFTTQKIFARFAQNIIDTYSCEGDFCHSKQDTDKWIDIVYLLRSHTDPARFNEIVEKIYITIQYQTKHSGQYSTFPLSAIKGMNEKIAQKLIVFTDPLEKTIRNEKLFTAFSQRLKGPAEKECDLKSDKTFQNFIVSLKGFSPKCHFYHSGGNQKNCAPISLSFQKSPRLKVCEGYTHTATPSIISKF